MNRKYFVFLTKKSCIRCQTVSGIIVYDKYDK